MSFFSTTILPTVSSPPNSVLRMFSSRLPHGAIVSVLVGVLAGCSIIDSNSSAGNVSLEQRFSTTDSREAHFEPIVPERWTLQNGLTVLYYRDDEVPLVSGTLYLRGGALHVPDATPGAVAALGGLMRSGGAGALSADELDQKLEKLSAGISSSFGSEFGTIAFASLAEDFGVVFGLAVDVLRRPRFEESRFALWQSQSLESIRRRIDDPRTVAGITLNQVLYANHQLGRSAKSTDVAAVSLQSLRTLHKTLARPDGALLVISGAVSRQAVEGRVSALLGDWEARRTVLPAPTVNIMPRSPGVFFIEQPLAQSTVYIGELGVPRLTPDMVAIDGFNEVFGAGGFSSRLVNKIRTTLGLAYDVYGAVIPGPVRGKNLMYVKTKGESTGKAIVESLKLLKELQFTVVADSEVEDMKKTIAQSFIFKFDAIDQTLSRRASLELLGFPADYDETYVGKIRALTGEDLKKVAKTRWNLSQLSIVVVGPQEARTSIETALRDGPEEFRFMPITQVTFGEIAEFPAP